jgi:hypothetical protein
MNSSEKPLEIFDQTHYDNTFYFCEKDHPFIAFTTVFCPCCLLHQSNATATAELEEAEQMYEDTLERLEELTIKAKNTAPEILV